MDKFLMKNDRDRFKFAASIGWGVAILLSLLNFLILIKYQIKMGGDFPYEDEWGYVDRLSHIHSIGFFHFLFDKYQTYFVPGLFFIWYLFYHFFDLSIMAIRKLGAATSAASALLICAIVLRQKKNFNLWELFLLGVIPFVFCSLNYWATYNQSIESITEPLLLGFVLLACLSAQQSLLIDSTLKTALLWSVVAVAFSFLAISLYAPGLSILLSISITRAALLRRIDGVTLALGGLGLAVVVLYSFLSGEMGVEHHIHFGTVGLVKLLEEWILLFGNSLITIGHPHSPIFYVLGIPVTYNERVAIDFIFGLIVVLGIFTSMINAFFAPSLSRIRYFVPFSLSVYSIGVSLEIAFAYHSPRFGEAPRYAILLAGAPIALILWGILSQKRLTLLGELTNRVPQAVVYFCTISTLIFMEVTMPQAKNFQAIRSVLRQIDSPITREQQKILKVNDPLRNMVYPDIQYLRRNHLACFRGGGDL